MEKVILSSKCAVCYSKKSRFIKEQKTIGFLSQLGVKTLSTKMSMLDDLLF